MFCTLSDRFWSKVDIKGPEECWPWLAGKTKQGYGRFRIDDDHVGVAHRIAFELATGRRLGKKSGLHSCDNPPCCNPSHVFPGTQFDNIQDARLKNRLRGGPPSKNKNAARLITCQVKSIRRLAARGLKHQDIISRLRLPVGRRQVSRIVNQTQWR